ncbi:serine hydrolase [Caulobacter sp. SL161]|uniref:serine hydrolase domain-containing protein n=1 Tax=Caulobacter sp. SL161 TaxID=2995156 RepID=UPI002272C09E|nr:serine hydrolase domain-containing protein [Caulobacter sp. SL161]MCY1647521.1 serine hydrolase [Caulobacter sp. SL161]
MRLLIAVAFVVAALAAPLTVSAEVALPSTPAGDAAKAYLRALNAGDRAKAAAFIKDSFPTSPIDADGLVGFARQVGGFDLVRIETETPTALTALVRERYGETYARLRVEVDPAAPTQIKALGARVAPRPDDIVAAPRLDDTALTRAVAEKLAVMGQNYSGVVLIARKGKPFTVMAQGFADREHRVPITPTTRFRVGSMNKMHTAVAVLQLAQAGKLDLQAPLITYLKDYPSAAWARKVTLHQLLTHTGGAGDFFGPEYDKNRNALRTLQDYVALYGAREPTFEPGARWEYANYGFILLGRVVEVVSGQSYYDYVRDHVFKPAGMTGSGFEPETTPVPDRALAYEYVGEVFKPADGLPWRGTSAGGGYATAEDFLRFAVALYDGRLLDQTHRRLMTTAQADDARGGKYGYGLSIPPSEFPMVGHGGGAPGMNGDLRILADGEGVVVTLSNVAPPFLAGRLSQFVVDRFSVP